MEKDGLKEDIICEYDSGAGKICNISFWTTNRVLSTPYITSDDELLYKPVW